MPCLYCCINVKKFCCCVVNNIVVVFIIIIMYSVILPANTVSFNLMQLDLYLVLPCNWNRFVVYIHIYINIKSRLKHGGKI